MVASMRPRVFPAEDRRQDASSDRQAVASMRPRVFPAEDFIAGAGTWSRQRVASMRPRVFPAEDGCLLLLRSVHLLLLQ